MKRCIIILVLVCFVNHLSSQESKEISQRLLTNALQNIEKAFDVKFSYDPKVLANYKVSIAIEEGLDITLHKIAVQTSLKIEKIDDRYYTILEKSLAKDQFCGFILDKFSKRPVAGAVIQNMRNAEFIRSGITGLFRIDKTKTNDKFVIRKDGYAPTTFFTSELNTSDCLQIFIEEDSQVLNEVLITDYLKNDTFRNALGSSNFNPVENKTFPNQADPDVLKMLQVLPGIQSISETASGTSIRGSNQNHSLVLWNGIRMYQTGHFFGIFSAFNPNVINDVSLYRSGTDPQFGGAVSGIIALNGPKEVSENLNGGVKISLTNANVFLQIPITDNLGLITSARRSLQDILSTTTFERYNDRIFQSVPVLFQNPIDEEVIIDNSNTSFFEDYTLKLLYKIGEKDQLSVNSLYTANDTNIAFDLVQANTSDSSAIRQQQQFVNTDNFGVGVDWDHQWTSTIITELNGYYSANSQNFRIIRDDTFPDANDALINSDNKLREYNLSVNNTININKNNRLSLGYEYSNVDINNLLSDILNPNTPEADSINTAITQKNRTHALFADYNSLIIEKVKLKTGIRTSTFSNIEDKQWYVEPRVVLEIAHSDYVKTRYSYEVKNQIILDQSIAFDENFGFRYDILRLATNNQQVLGGSQITAGALFSRKSWDVNIDTYYKKTNNITTETSDFDLFILPDAGESTVYGLDFFLKKKFKNYQFLLSYSYSKNRFQFNEFKNGETFDGNFDIPHNFTFNQTYSYKNFDFVLGWKIRSGIPFSRFELNEENILVLPPENVNSERLPSYHRLDFTTSYTFAFSKQKKKWRGKIALSLLNLYNQQNILDKSFIARRDATRSGDDRFFEEFNTTSLGFTPNVLFSIRF